MKKSPKIFKKAGIINIIQKKIIAREKNIYQRANYKFFY